MRAGGLDEVRFIGKVEGVSEWTWRSCGGDRGVRLLGGFALSVEGEYLLC